MHVKYFKTKNKEVMFAIFNSHKFCIKEKGFQKYRFNTNYRGADKSLARPGRKHTTTTEDFDVHISYL
jgi:hypothetical protein